MKKVICKKEYDTQTGEEVMRYTHSYYGDPAGYEEILYKTPGGLYFIYGRGGANSPYPEEDIIRLAKASVNAWMENHK